MTIRQMHHVGVVVSDLEAAAAFFVALGFVRTGGTTVEGEWVDRVVGLEGVRSRIAMLETPGEDGRLELTEFEAPTVRDAGAPASAPAPAPANALGLRHLAFFVDDLDAVLERLGAELVGAVATYGTMRLCYVRGPDGIIVELADHGGPDDRRRP